MKKRKRQAKNAKSVKSDWIIEAPGGVIYLSEHQAKKWNKGELRNRTGLKIGDQDRTPTWKELEDAEGYDAVRKNPKKRRNDKETEMIDAANKLYKKFHWGIASESMKEIHIPDLDAIVSLGKLVAIEYQTEKGGEPKGIIYRHDFESPVILAASADGKILLAFDGKLNVRPEGITG
jgi:hypothetical protein